MITLTGLCSVNFLCELFHVVNIMFIQHLRLLSSIIIVILLMLISTHNYARAQDRVVLKHLSMESGLRRNLKYISPRSIQNNSTLYANAGLSYS